MTEKNHTSSLVEVEIFRRERSGLLFGELVPSFKSIGWEVDELIDISFPVSMQLGLCAWPLRCAQAPAGVIAALKKNSLMDYIPMSTAMLGICLQLFNGAAIDFDFSWTWMV